MKRPDFIVGAVAGVLLAWIMDAFVSAVLDLKADLEWLRQPVPSIPKPE